MDIATVLVLARTAVNAVSELNSLLAEVRGKLSSEDEAELRPYLDKLRASNDELYATVQEKLARAAQE